MKIPFVSEYTDYFRTLKQYAGKSLYVLMGISLIVAATEGLGISMLLPLLQVSEVGQNSGTQGGEVINEAFRLLGIPHTFDWVLIVMGCLFFIKGLIKYLEGYMAALVRSRLFSKWRKELLGYYSNLKYPYYVSKNTGHFTNVLNAQVVQASTFVMQFIQFSSRGVLGIVYISIAFLINWYFSLLALAAGLVILLVLKGLSSATKEISVLNSEESSSLNKFLIQLLQSFKYLRSTARFSYLEKSASSSIDKLSGYQFKVGKYGAILMAVQEPMAVALMIGILAYQVSYLHEPLAPLLVVLVLLYRTMNVLMLAQSQWQIVMHYYGGLNIVSTEYENVEQNQEDKGPVKLHSFTEEIRFDKVSFSYGGDKNVIDNVSLSIPKYQTVALVGESGSGKTTITDLISMLLKPCDGKIFIDNQPADLIEQLSWRQKIGFVTQDTVIFDDTVAHNITLWEGDYDKDTEVQTRVAHAAEQAYCEGFISELPQGYLTQIGERGVKLSGGQKQRLSIARELYKQPEILILDEATSALDSESERYIQESIDALKGKMTVVIIAHRLSTIKNADKIIVLDKGQVKEEGSFEELTSIDSRFREMAEYQKL